MPCAGFWSCLPSQSCPFLLAWVFRSIASGFWAHADIFLGWAPRAVARKVMKELIVDWHGEAIAQSNGSVVYRFEQPAFELKEAKRLRAQRNDDFDSENTYIELKS
ncbi:hypothetical protein FHS56_000453 [Thermonema lapsum]|uniref:Uncharacterized protein n=1 Tax=Thermonema lapsum TaxID=28195 RepID=A0A846MNP5_9BACT|nr:hypothetical protein [Thermonema lapsum]NIK72967.1 hypothetical protein [Thermonema lapsum]